MRVNNEDMQAIPWNLIIRTLKDADEGSDSDQLKAWRTADPRHDKLWHELYQAWNDIYALNAHFNPDTSQAWQKVIKKTKKRHRRSSRLINMSWRMAAACILLLAGFGLGMLLHNNTRPAVTYTQYETQYGKSVVTLPDGTEVWLNSHTSLRLTNRFNDKSRHVELQGEAFFNVTHNPQCPFIVNVQDLDVTVLGTKFNVEAFDNRPVVKVALLEGSVSLSATDAPIDTVLDPGYTAIYARADKKMKIEPSDKMVTLWTNKELHIEDEPLEKVAELLERWYNIEIDVSPTLKDSHFYTFTVRNESPGELLIAMQKISKFKYKIMENCIEIYE